MGRLLGGQLQRQRFRQPDQRGQRRAQIVGQRRQQGIALPLRLHFDQRVAGDGGKMHPFQGDGDQRGESVQQPPLFRDHQQAPLLRRDSQHPARAQRGLERQVQQRRGGQSVGAKAGWIVAVETPLRDGEVHFRLTGPHRRRLQPIRVVRQQQPRLDPEAGFDAAFADFDHLLGGQRPGQLARHLVEVAGALLAGAGYLGLITEPGGQLADDQSHNQHHREGEEVLPVVDHEREARRHEEDVERQDVDHRREHRRAAPPPHRHADHRQQKQHDDIGQVEMGQQRGRRQRRAQADQQRRAVALRCDWQHGSLFVFGLGGRADGTPGQVLLRQRQQIEIRGQSSQSPSERLSEPTPAARSAATDDHPAQTVLARIFGDGQGDIGGGLGGGARAEILGQLEGGENRPPVGLGQTLQRRRFHVQGVPFAIQFAGQPASSTHQRIRSGAGTDAHQQCLAAGWRYAAVSPLVALHLVVHPVGGAPQRQLAQGDQITLAKEVLNRTLGLIRQVNLAFLEPLQQFVGRQINQHHLISLVEHPVGDRFPDPDAGDAADHVVEAFQMLHVDRGQNVNARFEQFFDILPALRMAATGRVAVRQLVHQDQRRPPRQGAVEIELPQHPLPIGNFLAWQHFQAIEQRSGFRATVGFDQTHHDIQSLFAPLAGGQ